MSPVPASSDGQDAKGLRVTILTTDGRWVDGLPRSAGSAPSRRSAEAATAVPAERAAGAPRAGGFFHTLLKSLAPEDREWVVATIRRYALINDQPDSPKPRL